MSVLLAGCGSKCRTGRQKLSLFLCLTINFRQQTQNWAELGNIQDEGDGDIRTRQRGWETTHQVRDIKEAEPQTCTGEHNLPN